jgi:hypothetical protein
MAIAPIFAAAGTIAAKVVASAGSFVATAGRAVASALSSLPAFGRSIIQSVSKGWSVVKPMLKKGLGKLRELAKTGFDHLKKIYEKHVPKKIREQGPTAIGEWIMERIDAIKKKFFGPNPSRSAAMPESAEDFRTILYLSIQERLNALEKSLEGNQFEDTCSFLRVITVKRLLTDLLVKVVRQEVGAMELTEEEAWIIDFCDRAMANGVLDAEDVNKLDDFVRREHRRNALSWGTLLLMGLWQDELVERRKTLNELRRAKSKIDMDLGILDRQKRVEGQLGADDEARLPGLKIDAEKTAREVGDLEHWFDTAQHIPAAGTGLALVLDDGSGYSEFTLKQSELVAQAIIDSHQGQALTVTQGQQVDAFAALFLTRTEEEVVKFSHEEAEFVTVEAVGA